MSTSRKNGVMWRTSTYVLLCGRTPSSRDRTQEHPQQMRCAAVRELGDFEMSRSCVESSCPGWRLREYQYKRMNCSSTYYARFFTYDTYVLFTGISFAPVARDWHSSSSTTAVVTLREPWGLGQNVCDERKKKKLSTLYPGEYSRPNEYSLNWWGKNSHGVLASIWGYLWQVPGFPSRVRVQGCPGPCSSMFVA